MVSNQASIMVSIFNIGKHWHRHLYFSDSPYFTSQNLPAGQHSLLNHRSSVYWTSMATNNDEIEWGEYLRWLPLNSPNLNSPNLISPISTHRISTHRNLNSPNLNSPNSQLAEISTHRISTRRILTRRNFQPNNFKKLFCSGKFLNPNLLKTGPHTFLIKVNGTLWNGIPWKWTLYFRLKGEYFCVIRTGILGWRHYGRGLGLSSATLAPSARFAPLKPRTLCHSASVCLGVA